jgi:hypothetical protein
MNDVYVVKSGDILGRIAQNNNTTVKKLLELNPYIINEDEIDIGQQIKLPTTQKKKINVRSKKVKAMKENTPDTKPEDLYPNSCPINDKNGINMFLYVFYKEVAKEGTLTRLTTIKAISYDYNKINDITQNPKKYGIIPRGDLIEKSNGIIKRPGLHALGQTNSIYTSASTIESGAKGFNYNNKFYIDIEVVKKQGGKIISTSEIIKDLNLLKGEQPQLSHRINKLLNVIDKIEGETLVEGRVSKTAVMTEFEYGMMKKMNIAGKGLTVLAIGLTAIDMKNATMKSVEQQSYKPVVAETIRQAGGWGGAWAGAQIGGIAGGVMGLETGPGAIVTGVIGGIVFGVAGYFGADWVADYIDEN